MTEENKQPNIEEVRDIRKDKEINEFQLLAELRILPSLIEYYSTELAEAKSHLATCKNKLDYVENEALLRILTEKTEEEGKKPTDKVLSAYVTTDAAVVAAKEQLLTAETVRNKLQVCTDVIESKAKAIHELVELRKISYYNADMTANAEAATETRSKAEILRNN